MFSAALISTVYEYDLPVLSDFPLASFRHLADFHFLMLKVTYVCATFCEILASWSFATDLPSFGPLPVTGEVGAHLKSKFRQPMAKIRRFTGV